MTKNPDNPQGKLSIKVNQRSIEETQTHSLSHREKMSAQKPEKKKSSSPPNKPKQHKSLKPNLPSKPKVTKENGDNSKAVNTPKPAPSNGGWAAILAVKSEVQASQPSKQVASKPTKLQSHQNSSTSIDSDQNVNSEVNTHSKLTTNPDITPIPNTNNNVTTTDRQRKRSQSPQKKKKFNSDEVLSFLQGRTDSLSEKAKAYKPSGTDWSKPVKTKKDHRNQDVVNFELVKHLRKRGNKD